MRSEQAALEAAHQIEDIFCQHHAGGRIQRMARIQVAICDAIARASGKKSDEHRGISIKPSNAPAWPSASSSAKAAHSCAVGPAPAVADERPAQVHPQPASTAAVQDEAAVNQGEDQRAQKEKPRHTAPPVGAAEEADVSCADPRNSSRPAGEAASAPLPVDRTDKKTDRKPSQRERVLELWSTTDLSTEAIAAEVGCAKSSIRAYISMAKADGDIRATNRPAVAKALHEDASDRIAVLPPPVLIPQTPRAEDRQPTKAGFAKPVEAKPAKAKSEPLNPRPGRIVGVTIDSPGSVVSLDMQNFVVACPEADWQVTRPVARVIERLRNGDMFDPKMLADAAPMGLETFLAAIPRWTADLAIRGVELVFVKGIGCRLRRAGE